jgi:CRISPR/Cas system CSM-associated protein Csm3 (group 7 of RAMP superfamily)
MFLRGQLLAESPIYRGNARKTLFTRDGDGSQRLVSLAGEISGTAESLMDAFIGQSRNHRNIGLLDRLWQRLYGNPMPNNLVTKVECRLQEQSYPQDRFFDMRMGIKLDEDRWAAEADANYKMETVFRNAVFDFSLQVNDNVLQQNDNKARLFYLLEELKAGRFWFGAGKSKGLGRCRLEMDLPFSAEETPIQAHAGVNHLTIAFIFNAANPVLVGWNWGKVDPNVPAFAAVEGRVLLEGMRNMPEPIQERLKMSIGGPILSADDWTRKLATYLPRTVAIWLREQSVGERETWTLSSTALAKLGKGKFALSKKAIRAVQPLTDTPFPSQEAAETAITHALGDRANMANRILRVMEHHTETGHEFNQSAWQEVATSLGLDLALADRLAEQLDDEAALARELARACQPILPQLAQQVSRQIRLLESDVWVDAEIANREQHIKIKQMLRNGQITEEQWGDPQRVPPGVSVGAWREFMDSHRRVRYRHMLSRRNLNKSITNDQNFIAFLQAYRNRTRQELAQPHHTDFRAGGSANREISRKYGKPYDTVFMRMLSWAPSAEREGAWEVYIPGSTIKGAFRKRASQILKTLWADEGQINELLDQLFGAQGRQGQVLFSDAYLTDPQDPERAWCSMDGVRMDPKTGQPVTTAKTDYLYAYGDHLAFQLRLDLQDIGEEDLLGLTLLQHLIRDFQRGDIPIGGEKTSGFGWVQATVTSLRWLTADAQDLTQQLFGAQTLTQDGLWQKLDLNGEAAAGALQPKAPLTTPGTATSDTPPKAEAGFISHRAFGGYSGTLAVEAEVLTPLNIQESGEPSYSVTLDDQPVNGWDFFSMSPAEASLRGEERLYVLPSKSLKGMLHHLYAIASNSNTPSPDISQLNPADSLFGWVGSGQNQALMGRVSFSFGLFDKPQLAWFKVPYPYGHWQYNHNEWQNISDQSAAVLLIGQNWRLFPHTPLAPIVQQLETFAPDTPQAHYVRAILPGSRCRFTIRFWNLEKAELQRLMWCVVLEEGLAHKMGNGRYLGFGSLRFHLLPESFLIDWASRYAGQEEESWRLPLKAAEWINRQTIRFYADLQKALDAKQL